MPQDSFPLERFDDIKKRPSDFRLLERIPLTMPGMEEHFPLELVPPIEGERIHHAVFLDTETTGLHAGEDKIIELGMVRCTYSFDRKIILSIDSFYDEFEDPGRPIPFEIQNLTHITDDMVSGQAFNEDKVNNILAGRPLVIAHNASFDRPFFDKRFPILSELSWACSIRDIRWDTFGGNGTKLEYLNMTRGWFYEAHRAYVDTLALIWLMHIEPEAFSMLIENALHKTYRVTAVGSPYDIKDKLKEMGYRFNGNLHSWSIMVPTQEEADKQIAALQSMYNASEAMVEVLTARNRYKMVR